jgi:hypothetical protein
MPNVTPAGGVYWGPHISSDWRQAIENASRQYGGDQVGQMQQGAMAVIGSDTRIPEGGAPESWFKNGYRVAWPLGAQPLAPAVRDQPPVCLMASAPAPSG